MHMILRTILVFLKRPFLRKCQFHDKTSVTMRVLPTDLDLLWHVNNGVYFSFMDFGRWDMVFRNGTYQLCSQQGWYAVVAGETIKFKKSLELWNKFQLETRNIGHDDKYFFIQQKFIYQGELMATGLVKIRFLKRTGGTVSAKEVMDLVQDHQLPDLSSELGQEWFGLESKYLV